ncbi:hypothetical protein GF366_00700, partial [Candidatus Peregrinibacteria bacterium]|nr:hypothetical protein [Candidatus Peregrinibacteria bacterium]
MYFWGYNPFFITKNSLLQFIIFQHIFCATCSGGGASQSVRSIYPSFSKTFQYDLRGRKIEETDVLIETEQFTTAFEYDKSGNLELKTDKMENTTSYQYDALNRLTPVIDAMNNETIYEYDNRDNLITLKDANQNTTRFEYDRNNR